MSYFLYRLIGADRQDFRESLYKVKMLAINVLCVNKNINNMSLNVHCYVEKKHNSIFNCIFNNCLMAFVNEGQ